MKSTRTLLAVALASAGLIATTAAEAQSRGHGGGGGHSMSRGGGGGNSMSRGGGHVGGSGHWAGRGSSGNWSGRGGHWNGARSVGYGRHWGGYRGSYYRPRVGFYFGLPLLWGAYYGAPYYYGSPYYYNDYPSTTVIYRDRDVEPYPMASPEDDDQMTTEVPQGAEGAPTEGPTYMNYCESAKAYYPKVTQCPEGWKFLPSR